jgi:hypothetical protein
MLGSVFPSGMEAMLSYGGKTLPAFPSGIRQRPCSCSPLWGQPTSFAVSGILFFKRTASPFIIKLFIIKLIVL